MKNSSIICVIIVIIFMICIGVYFMGSNANDDIEFYKKQLESDIHLVNTYYYKHLNPEQKEIYIRILSGCEKFESFVNLKKNSLDDVYIARNAVACDHPEFFWTSTFMVKTIREKATQISFTIPSNAEEQMELIKNKADEIVTSLPIETTEKLKFIYDWIVNNTEYGNSANSQEINSVFIDRISVCSGYSKAFQYLCQKAGIPCTYVAGFTKEDEPHAWNLVRINNNYYWIDVTWGDPVFVGMSGNYTNYNYFLASDSDFLNNHIIDYKIRMQDGTNIDMNIEYPQCNDNSLNYYSINGCYFATYNKNEIEKYIVEKIKAKNYQNIEFKFASNDDYTRFFKDFFTGNNEYVFRVIRNALGTNERINIGYSYIDNANYLSLNIKL